MSNFSFLQDQFPLLAELGEKGEHYLYTDPNACLFKLRFLGEKVVELMFQYDKEPDPTDHSQVQRIRYLEAEDYLPRTVADSLTVLRKVGNKAVHDNYASERDAGLCLQVAYGICGSWQPMGIIGTPTGLLCCLKKPRRPPLCLPAPLSLPLH